MPSDLHIHTTFSDGRNTPEEIMEAAKAAGLRYISITDHDSVEGVRRSARRVGRASRRSWSSCGGSATRSVRPRC